jgi:hypothetical protein
MAAGVPPPPLNSPTGSYYWLEWYTNLTNFLNGTNIPWSNLNFTGSNITDILTRNHNDLQNIQGGSGTGQATGNHWHISGRGFVSASGTATGFPSGWNATHPGTGIYVITHPLALAAPSISAVATSNTTGVLVLWIDNSVSGQLIVHTVNLGGVATDGAFSIIVNS